MASALSRPSNTGTDDLSAFKRKVYIHLSRTGVVSSMKTQLRSHLVDALVSHKIGTGKSSYQTSEVYILNLFRNFLGWHGLKYSLSVLDMELGGYHVCQDVSGDKAIRATLELLQHPSRQAKLLQEYQQAQDKLSFPAFFLQELLKADTPATKCDAVCQTEAIASGTLTQKLLQVSQRFEPNSNTTQSKDTGPRLPGDVSTDRSSSEQFEQAGSTRTAQKDDTFCQDVLSWKKQQTEQMRADEEHTQRKLKLYQDEVERAAFEHRQNLMQEQARLLAWQSQLHKQYQTQQAEVHAVRKNIADKELSCLAKELAAKQQLVSAVKLVEQVHADALQAVEQDRKRQQSDMDALDQHWKEVVTALKSEQHELLQRLKQDEEEKEKGFKLALALQNLCTESQLRSDQLESELIVLRSELGRLQSRMSDEQPQLQRKAMEVEEKLQSLQQKMVENGLPSSAALEEQISMLFQTVRSLQSEKQVLQSELGLKAKQVEEWKVRAVEAQRILSQADARKEEVAQQLDELYTTAMQYEEENHHLRSRISMLKQEVMASKIRPPGSPLPGSPITPSSVPHGHNIRLPTAYAFPPQTATPITPLSPPLTSILGNQPVSSSFCERLEDLRKLDAAVRREHSLTKHRISQHRIQADSILSTLYDWHVNSVHTTGAPSGQAVLPSLEKPPPGSILPSPDLINSRMADKFSSAPSCDPRQSWAQAHLPSFEGMFVATDSVSHLGDSNQNSDNIYHLSHQQEPIVASHHPSLSQPNPDSKILQFTAANVEQHNTTVDAAQETTISSAHLTTYQSPHCDTAGQPVAADSASITPRIDLTPSRSCGEHHNWQENTSLLPRLLMTEAYPPIAAINQDSQQRAPVQPEQEKQLPIIVAWQDSPRNGSPSTEPMEGRAGLKNATSIANIELANPDSSPATAAAVDTGTSEGGRAGAQEANTGVEHPSNPNQDAATVQVLNAIPDGNCQSPLAASDSFPELPSTIVSDSSSSEAGMLALPEGPSQEVEDDTFEELLAVEAFPMSAGFEEEFAADGADNEEDDTNGMGAESNDISMQDDMMVPMGDSMEEIAADMESMDEASAASDDSVF